jgi:hypothetical protein
MYDGYHFNLYNAGEVYTPDLSSIYYIETSGFKGRYGNLFVLQQMDSIAFLSGVVKDSLNMYVSQNPKEYCYDRDSVPLLSWVQGEDGFPRFEGVDLQPTHGYVVHFKGAIKIMKSLWMEPSLCRFALSKVVLMYSPTTLMERIL